MPSKWLRRLGVGFAVADGDEEPGVAMFFLEAALERLVVNFNRKQLFFLIYVGKGNRTEFSFARGDIDGV